MIKTKKAVAQTGYISYELHSLGWKAFQDLCGTILSEVFGQTYQIFSPGRDGGRDGSFQGTWKHQSNLTLKGSFTVQCKFSTRKEKYLSIAIIKEDLDKAHDLHQKGLADNYLLITNYKLSGKSEEQIRRKFLSIGIRECLIFGEEKISHVISQSPKLRRLVPRVYGLGDLSQILDERAYSQAKQLLLSLQDDLAKFVPTEAYRKSARALSSHGFVLLLGEPASGKSIIAATLALSAADEWRCETLKVESAEDFKRHWNPHEPRQFFWVDDVFGATQYQAELVQEWNRKFLELQAAINKGARVVFTSRDYIYMRAKEDLKDTSFPLLRNSQVIINVQDLTIPEKKDILYNHIKRGDQPIEYRKSIKVLLEGAADSKHFQPEIARRLGTKAFTKELIISGEGIHKFFEKPEDFLLSVISGLGPDEKSGLALIFMHGGILESPISFSSRELDAVSRMGGTKSGVVKAMTAMKNSLVKLEQVSTGMAWVVKHPTIRDAFANLVHKEQELLDIYLHGTNTKKLVAEVVCGKVELEGAKVVVPPSRFGMMINRLNSAPKDWDGTRMVDLFLAYRCSREFLELYIDSNPNIFERLEMPRSYLYAVSEVPLIVRFRSRKLTST